MRALIVDDDRSTAAILAAAVRRCGLEGVVAHDGPNAWQVMRGEQPPPLAIVDWMMPGLDGLELTRRIRQTPALVHTYVILLTARDGHADVVAGLQAGANDYLVKPFDLDEFCARVESGKRTLLLHRELHEQIGALRDAIVNIKQLKGLLPICSYCKSIRQSDAYWQQLETYITDHSDARFSHGICPDCVGRMREALDLPAESGAEQDHLVGCRTADSKGTCE